MDIALNPELQVSLLIGLLMLIVPRLLNYTVATYRIVVGLLRLFGDMDSRA